MADDCYGLLRQTKQSFADLPADLPDGPSALFGQSIADYEAETQRQEKAGLLAPNQRAAGCGPLLPCTPGQGSCATPRPQTVSRRLRCCGSSSSSWQTSARRPRQPPAQRWKQPSTLWSQAFGESQELVVFVTELTMDPAAHAFLVENGCERYFRYNQDLLLDSRKAALQRELAAEQRRSES